MTFRSPGQSPTGFPSPRPSPPAGGSQSGAGFNPGNYANMAPSQRPPAFSQTAQTPWGQMDPSQYFQQQQAFAQTAVNQHSQAAKNAGVGSGSQPPAPYDPSQMWASAGQMVAGGWQNPFGGSAFAPSQARPIQSPYQSSTPYGQPAPPPALPRVASEEVLPPEKPRWRFSLPSVLTPSPAKPLPPGKFRDPQTGRVFNKADVPTGGWLSPKQLAAWRASERANSDYMWDETTRQMQKNPLARQ